MSSTKAMNFISKSSTLLNRCRLGTTTAAFFSRNKHSSVFEKSPCALKTFPTFTRRTSSLSAEGIIGPRVQKKAPNFEGLAVVKGDFQAIQLNDFAQKYLYLFFYPLDFTFVCPTEIIAFSDRIEDFNKINTNVVGVSCDSHFSHLAWINTPRKAGGLGELNYPLLSDFNKTISRNYGVLLENDGVPLRGSFIIDPKGIVRQITINDLPVGRSVDEVIRLIKAFQFTDVHGEVCPADWNPEKPTIKPTPKESKEYFKNVK